MKSNSDLMYETLVKRFKEDKGFVNHQIESFNSFIDSGLQKIINEIGEIPLENPEAGEFKIKLGEVSVGRPNIREADGATREILPIEARIRNLNYVAPIKIEMTPVINGIEQETSEIDFGALPIMLKSKACYLSQMSPQELIEAGEDPNDPGGYFIINGTERVLVTVEEIVQNRPIIEKKRDIVTARINSEISGFVQRHVIECRKGLLYVSFANLKNVPLVVILRALGFETDKEIIDAIAENEREEEEIYFNIYEFPVSTKAEAIDYIGKLMRIPQVEYRKERVDQILDKYLMPHLGQSTSDRSLKADFLSRVASKVLKVSLKEIRAQDIDHYMNKRIKLAGDFLEILFRSVLLGKYGLVARIQYTYQKLAKRGKLPSLQSIVEGSYLTKRIISHMSTGQWVGGRTGVSQRLERTNFIRTVDHLRNVLSPLSSAQEHFEARELHATHWGRLCAEQTPEGINIGLRKYMALFATISKGINEKEMKDLSSLIQKVCSNEGRRVR